MSEVVWVAVISGAVSILGTLIAQRVLLRTKTREAQATETHSVLSSVDEIAGAASAMVAQYGKELLAARAENAENREKITRMERDLLHISKRLEDEIEARRRENTRHLATSQELNRELGEARERIGELTARNAALEDVVEARTARIAALETEVGLLTERLQKYEFAKPKGGRS